MAKAAPVEFTLPSPRSYRGKAGWDGHDGRRTDKGTWAASEYSRKRWTTALREDALDELHDLAAATGVNRCEVVEALLLDPKCRALALAAIKGAAKSEATTLAEAVAQLCEEHGDKWPRGTAVKLAQAHGVTKQAVSQFKQRQLQRGQ